MGGTPNIDGGMSYAERQQLLKEEREFQAEQEASRRAQALEDERKREEEARAERERLAQEEANRIAEINQAEEAVIEESKATEKKSDLKKVSFYEALGKGISSEKPL